MRPYWTCVITHRGEEGRAAHHVERQSFEYYHPLMYVPHKGGLRREAIFRGYLFVQVHDGWKVLASTRGIRRLLMNPDGMPAHVATPELEFLRQLEDDSGIVNLPPQFAAGDRVRYVAGKRHEIGMSGIVRRLGLDGRVEISLRILGREIIKKERPQTLRLVDIDE